MISLDPKNLANIENMKWLSSGVAPRPIALVSTISDDGIPNLSPFSFFNAFGSNPPVIAFSPSRRGKDNTLKDTYNNLMMNKECVVASVTYDILEQMNLASSEFKSDVNEFIKSGFTPLKSNIVKPSLIKESPFQMECKLMHMFHTGENHGAGNIAICEVVQFHIDESILVNNSIDPNLIDLVARNGASYYTRAYGDALFELAKPPHNNAIGYENLPDYIKNSEVLTANNIARLALSKSIPSEEECNSLWEKTDEINGDILSFNRYKKAKNYKKMLSVLKFLVKRGNINYKRYFHETAQIAIEIMENDNAFKIIILSTKY